MFQKVRPQTTETTDQNSAVDQGWAWVVAFAGTLTVFLGIGMYRSLAILMAEFIDIYDRPTADISLIFTFSGIGQCLTALLLIFGLGDLFHERALVVAAGVLPAVGFIVTYFSSRLTDVYVLGFCSGTVMQVAQSCALSMVGQYFRRRLALASAIVCSGIGLGTLVLSPLLQWLLDEFTYRGAALIMAAVCLNKAVSGALMRPNQTDRKTKLRKKTVSDEFEIGVLTSAYSSMKELKNQAINDDDEFAKETQAVISGNNHNLDETMAGIHQNAKINCQVYFKSVEEFVFRPKTSRNPNESVWKSIRFSIKFFKSPFFVLLQIFVYFSTVGCEALLSFYPSFTRELGMTSYQSAFLLSIVGGADICGRLFYGFLADCKFMESYKLLLIPINILGCAAFLSRFATEFWSQVLYAVVIGLNYGTLFSLRSVILLDFFGQATLLRRLGVINLITGLGHATSGVLLGSIRDHTADYTLPLQVTGSIFFASGLSLMAIALQSCCQQDRNGHTCN